MKIIEYETAQGSSVSDLDKSVNAMLKAGFQPFGNPYLGNPYLSDTKVDGMADTFVVWQAMVRVDPPVASVGR